MSVHWGGGLRGFLLGSTQFLAMFEPHANAVVAHRYRLLHEIGRGGMGSVWKATDIDLDAPCALKFIVNQHTKPSEIRARFVREAKAVARLQTPHVVSIRGVGEWEGALYIAMELLAGETLFSRLAHTKTLSPRDTCRVVTQVASVLTIAHSEGIVHRDLKPENIWLWSHGELFVKLLDFGVAKHALDEGSLLKTATGMLVGTPYYMSPEQAAGDRQVDYRSDLWSLAIIAAQCLGGRLPFQSNGLGLLLASIIHGNTPPLTELYSGSTPDLERWWATATAKDPAARFQSAEALAREFTLALGFRPLEPSVAAAAQPMPDLPQRNNALAATSSLSPVTANPSKTQSVGSPGELWRTEVNVGASKDGASDEGTSEDAASEQQATNPGVSGDVAPRLTALVTASDLLDVGSVVSSPTPAASPPPTGSSPKAPPADGSQRLSAQLSSDAEQRAPSIAASASAPSSLPLATKRRSLAALAVLSTVAIVAMIWWSSSTPNGDDVSSAAAPETSTQSTPSERATQVLPVTSSTSLAPAVTSEAPSSSSPPAVASHQGEKDAPSANSTSTFPSQPATNDQLAKPSGEKPRANEGEPRRAPSSSSLSSTSNAAKRPLPPKPKPKPSSANDRIGF